MRLTIERLRTLVLGAGILLLAALAVFLTVGKWKNPFNRHDLPRRLGMEIQQEANGVTYTQAHGGHTLFKIHASKVVQLKKGNALLHDVWIDLYSADGKSVDRIAGSEFEYDQKAGTATAAGPVEITLMRPGETPAIVSEIAPKAAGGLAGPAAGNKPTPLSSAAKAAARGQIHVETSGLTFDQKSGIATTSQYVQFSTVQGTGSSMGATFDSEKGLLTLDREVELTTSRGTAPVQLHAQHAEFERDSQLCRLGAATADYQGGTATAGKANLLFRQDGSAVRLDASGGFTLTAASGADLTAPSGQMEFDEHNRPRAGRLEGGVAMESSSDRGGIRRQLHGTAPTVDLEFNPQGQLRHAHLERGVDLDSEVWSGPADDPVHMSRHWRSPVADVEFRASARGQMEPEAVQGTGGVVVTGESRRGHEAAATARLSADQVTGTFGRDAQLTDLKGVGHASVAETTATGAIETTSGDRLEAHLSASSAGGAEREASGAGQIQSATVEGDVVLIEQSAAKAGHPAPPPLRATAGRADYAGVGQWLHLTVNPRVEDGALQLTADKVDVSQASGDAFAHGNVKASWMQAAATKGGQAEKTASMGLGGQGPAHVIAAEAELNRSTGDVTFRGQARLWQQGNSVSAPAIVLDRERQSLRASTHSAAQPVEVVLVAAGGSSMVAATGKDAGKSGQTTVIRVRGGDLRYSNLQRTALMRGGVLGKVVANTGTGTSVSQEVEVVLAPKDDRRGQEQDLSQESGQVESLTARGHVVLSSAGRRATGEQLVYTGATDEYVLTGTAAAPPKMTDPARGTVTGEALIFHGRDDSVRIEGGQGKTTTETTAPR